MVTFRSLQFVVVSRKVKVYRTQLRFNKRLERKIGTDQVGYVQQLSNLIAAFITFTRAKAGVDTVNSKIHPTKTSIFYFFFVCIAMDQSVSWAKL